MGRQLHWTAQTSCISPFPARYSVQHAWLSIPSSPIATSRQVWPRMVLCRLMRLYIENSATENFLPLPPCPEPAPSTLAEQPTFLPSPLLQRWATTPAFQITIPRAVQRVRGYLQHREVGSSYFASETSSVTILWLLSRRRDTYRCAAYLHRVQCYSHSRTAQHLRPASQQAEGHQTTAEEW